MAKNTLFSGSLVLLLLFLSLGVSAQEIQPRSDALAMAGDYAPDQLLVRFRPTVSSQRAQQILAQHGLNRTKHLSAIDVHVLKLPPGLSVMRGAALLKRHPEVSYVEPNYILRAQALTQAEIADQWSMQKIRAEAAWDLVPEGASALVAIVDTGIKRDHPDLSASIWTNEDEISGNGIDDDNNGYVDDTWGWDLQNNDNDPYDDYMHGTAVSSVIAAAVDGLGIAGVCPMCKLMSVKVLNASGAATLDTVAAGIVYAADNGAQVVNLSLGGAVGGTTLQNAVDYAWAQGALVVAAAGNNGTETVFYPAGYENAIAAASTNEQDFRSCFSNYGDGFISVAAPGEAVLTADLSQEGYGIYSGTSLSAPHVSGLGGLLFAQDPGRTAAEVRALIENENTLVDLGPTGYDAFFGHGRIDALWALGGGAPTTEPPAGLFTDDLTASGYAHARKLARDASGRLHLVWHGRDGELYRVLYASSENNGESWSPPEVIFQSSAETYHPALAVYGNTVYVAFPSQDGSPNATYRVFFASRPDGGAWSTAVAVTTDAYHAVRPDLYVDPSNGKLHLVASSLGTSEEGSPYVYYTASEDGGATWSAVLPIQAGASELQLTRYADVHAFGPNVYIAGRTIEFTLFGLLPHYRVFAMRSTDSGESWIDKVELAAHDGLFTGEYGVSLAGVRDDLYLTYENGGVIYFRSNSDAAGWSEPVSMGTGSWPSISQADDGQAWLMFVSGESGQLSHYTGGVWEPVETVYENGCNYPNLKLGTSGGVVEWMYTHCSGAPYRLEYGARWLEPVDMPPSASIVAPGDGAMVDDTYRVLVSARDDNALTAVQLSVDGADYFDITNDFDGTHYFYDWDTTLYADGAHSLQARAIDSADQGAESAMVTATVENVNYLPDAVDDSGATDEDTPLNVPAPGILSNDSDPDSDPLTVVAVDGEAVNVGQQIVLGSGALLTVDSTGGYSYDPNGQFEFLGVGETAQDSFTYTISDGVGGSAIASVNVTVAGVNDAPAAVQDSATVDESGADIAVLVNDSDPEGDPLTVTDVTDPANGTAAIDGDMVRYDPDPGFCLQDGFTYTVSDSNGGFDSATVSVQVTCANIPPVATFAYSCNDLTCTFDASGSDDPDGSIDSYNWDFGDSTDSGEIIDHTYDAAGIYSVVLTVTDDGGATDADIQDVTVSEPPDTMHIGDLDGDRTTNKNKWTARVTLEVHDSAHNPVSNATVSGTWSEGAIGTSACTTDASGQCMVSQAGILKRVPSVAFSVDDITQETLLYSPAENHDEGGDSDGTTVTVYLEVLTNQPPVASFIYSCVDLACDFDASASTDPDGSVAVYEWNFGDGNTDAVSGVVAYHAYASDGSYTVALTVTDNEGASDTDTQTVTVGESSNTIFVFAIDMSGKVGGLNRSATATVTIHDTDGNQVEGAMVYGTWSGDYSATVSGVTGPDGSVTFNSSKVRQANATFIFTVDSVVKSGYSYDSGLNAETIDTIVVP